MKTKSVISFILLALLLCSSIIAAAVVTPQIDRIEVRGNQRFSAKEIIAWSDLTAGDLIQDDMLLPGMKRILANLAENGYFFASIDSLGTSFNTDSAFCDLTIFLNEGPRLILQEAVVSAGDSSAEDILQIPAFPLGSELERTTIPAAAEEILDQADEKGHPFAKLTVEQLILDRKPDSYYLKAEYNLDSGPRVRLAGITISGNETTQNSYIVRETRLKTGRLFSQNSFDSARRYLINTGLFEEVQPFGLIRLEDDYYALVELKEGRYNSIDGAVGYFPAGDDEDGYWTGLVDLSFKNLFGSGRRFKIHWQQPDRYSQDLALSYREPWLLGYPLDIEFGLDQSINAAAGYSEWGDGAKVLSRITAISAYYRFSEDIEIGAGVLNEESIPDSIARYVSGIPHSLTWGGTAVITFDGRDRPGNPRSGYYYSTAAEVADKKNYVAPNSGIPQSVRERKWSADLELAIPIWKTTILDLRVHGQKIDSEQEILPISELYYLGGATSLRGYREMQFAGHTIAWSNLELRWILGRYSRLTLFTDLGYYARNLENGDGGIHMKEAWHLSYGTGIDFETGLGIIGIDYGIAQGDPPAAGKIHFRLKNEF